MANTGVKTTAYSDGTREGRAILLTDANIDKVNTWIGALSEITRRHSRSRKEQPPKLKIKTEKGYRVAFVGDTVLKFGKGVDSTYLVVKAEK